MIPLKETVYPSNEKTISVLENDDDYGGAHRYAVRLCNGFYDGKTQYENSGCWEDDFIELQFVQKKPGLIITGLQNEQLIIILKDRIKKIDAKFPHPENQNMLQALDDFLAASKRRIDERMERGVMGELKK